MSKVIYFIFILFFIPFSIAQASNEYEIKLNNNEVSFSPSSKLVELELSIFKRGKQVRWNSGEPLDYSKDIEITDDSGNTLNYKNIHSSVKVVTAGADYSKNYIKIVIIATGNIDKDINAKVFIKKKPIYLTSLKIIKSEVINSSVGKNTDTEEIINYIRGLTKDNKIYYLTIFVSIVIPFILSYMFYHSMIKGTKEKISELQDKIHSKDVEKITILNKLKSIQAEANITNQGIERGVTSMSTTVQSIISQLTTIEGETVRISPSLLEKIQNLREKLETDKEYVVNKINTVSSTDIERIISKNSSSHIENTKLYFDDFYKKMVESQIYDFANEFEEINSRLDQYFSNTIDLNELSSRIDISIKNSDLYKNGG